MNTLSIPLSLIDIEKNYGKKITIDYSISKIKGSSFFTYLSNLNMDYDLVGLEKCTLLEKKDLLSYLVNSKKVLVDFPDLVAAYYEVIFTSLGLKVEENSSFLSPEEISELIRDHNKELLIEDSILFLTFCFPLMLLILNKEDSILEQLEKAPKFGREVTVTNGMVSLLYSSEWGLLVSNQYTIFDLTKHVVDYSGKPLHRHIFNEKNPYTQFLVYTKESMVTEEATT